MSLALSSTSSSRGIQQQGQPAITPLLCAVDQPHHLLELPEEVVRQILGYLEFQDVLHIKCTALAAARHVAAPSLWAGMLMRDFTAGEKLSANLLQATLQLREFCEFGGDKHSDSITELDPFRTYMSQARRHTVEAAKAAKEARLQLYREWESRVLQLTTRRAWLMFIPRRLYQDSWTTQQVDALGWWVFWAMCTAAVSWACVWEGGVWGGLGACAYVLRMMMAHMCFAGVFLCVAAADGSDAEAQRIANDIAHMSRFTPLQALVQRLIEQGSLSTAFIVVGVTFGLLGACGHFVGLCPHAPWLLQVLLLLIKDLLLPARWICWAVLGAYGFECVTTFARGPFTLQRLRASANETELVIAAGAVTLIEGIVWCMWWWTGSLPGVLLLLRHAWMLLQSLAGVGLTSAAALALCLIACAAAKTAWRVPVVRGAIGWCTSFPLSFPWGMSNLDRVWSSNDMRDLKEVLAIGGLATLAGHAVMALLHMLRVVDVDLMPHLLWTPNVAMESTLQVLCAFADQAVMLLAAAGIVIKIVDGRQWAELRGSRHSCESADLVVSWLMLPYALLVRSCVHSLWWLASYDGAPSLAPSEFWWLSAEEGTQWDPLVWLLWWVVSVALPHALHFVFVSLPLYGVVWPVACILSGVAWPLVWLWRLVAGAPAADSTFDWVCSQCVSGSGSAVWSVWEGLAWCWSAAWYGMVYVLRMEGASEEIASATRLLELTSAQLSSWWEFGAGEAWPVCAVRTPAEGSPSTQEAPQHMEAANSSALGDMSQADPAQDVAGDAWWWSSWVVVGFVLLVVAAAALGAWYRRQRRARAVRAALQQVPRAHEMGREDNSEPDVSELLQDLAETTAQLEDTMRNDPEGYGGASRVTTMAELDAAPEDSDEERAQRLRMGARRRANRRWRL